MATTSRAARRRTLGQLIATVRSPQFQQQMGIFSQALQTGQLDLRQFGLSPKVSSSCAGALGRVQLRASADARTGRQRAATQGFSIADFLEAIQELVDKEGPAAGASTSQPSPPAGGEGGDKDHPMS